MSKSIRVLVLGGNGFVGRHAVRQLVQSGASVAIGTRAPDTTSKTPQEILLLHDLATDWDTVTSRFDVVLNCVGILRQRPGETYEAVHHLAPAAIATACKRTSTRFIHVSALGLSETAKSRFLTSKYRGEQAILATRGNCMIARLSLLDGEGGYGADWLRAISRLPVFVVPTSAVGRIAALTADDAGEALSRLCLRSPPEIHEPQPTILELGGVMSFPFEEYIRGLRTRYNPNPAMALPIPGWIARLGAHLCDLVHFSPFSFGHWELLCSDNVPARQDLKTILERKPTEVIQSYEGKAAMQEGNGNAA